MHLGSLVPQPKKVSWKLKQPNWKVENVDNLLTGNFQKKMILFVFLVENNPLGSKIVDMLLKMNLLSRKNLKL